MTELEKERDELAAKLQSLREMEAELLPVNFGLIRKLSRDRNTAICLGSVEEFQALGRRIETLKNANEKIISDREKTEARLKEIAKLKEI